MSPDDIDRRITELERVLPTLAEGSAELRAARADLAALLGARYIAHNGAADDQRRAQELAQGVLADESATAAERQRMSLLRVALIMIINTSAAALRNHRRPDAEAIRLTEEWRRTTDPATITAGLDTVKNELATILDAASLPPEVRSALGMVQALTPL